LLVIGAPVTDDNWFLFVSSDFGCRAAVISLAKGTPS